MPSHHRLEVFKLHEDASIPFRAHPTDVGWDIHAYLMSETNRPITKALHQKGVTMIPTGIVVRPPPEFFIQVASRSGLAKQSIFVANAPGIVDPDYNGEIIVLLFNGSHETKYVKHGDRIAQLVLAPAIYAEIAQLKTLPKSVERGAAGFGSTGD